MNGSAANVGTIVAGAHGSLLLNSDGTYAYHGDSSRSIRSKPATMSTDQFNFTVDDGLRAISPTRR